MDPFAELVHHHRKIYRRHEKEFRSTFQLELRNFWQTFFGFDIILFDEYMKPGKQSLKDYIYERYGQDAVDLIYKLIDHTTPFKETDHVQDQ